jgi:hypothetical protein
MTMDLETILDEITLFVERPHISCCIIDKFFCGRPFHPELIAVEADDEDDCCKTCIDIWYETMCPSHRPTHEHCPFNLQRVCSRPSH